MTRPLALLAAIAGGVFALDQATKQWATATLRDRPPVEIVGTLVQLTYTRNSGVAFGLGAGTHFPFYLFSVAAAAVILWLFLRGRVRRRSHQIALALVLGVALGNLVDRVTTGLVVDFILLSWKQWDFPVFNVADSAVTVGVLLFALTWTGHHDEHAHAGGAALGGTSGGPGDPPAVAIGGAAPTLPESPPVAGRDGR